MHSASTGEWLKQDLLRIAEKLGRFPHRRLSFLSEQCRKRLKQALSAKSAALRW
jgi:hypothetical protein